jgi:hypothetical protein
MHYFGAIPGDLAELLGNSLERDVRPSPPTIAVCAAGADPPLPGSGHLDDDAKQGFKL